jgi:hypothetical protein
MKTTRPEPCTACAQSVEMRPPAGRPSSSPYGNCRFDPVRRSLALPGCGPENSFTPKAMQGVLT